MKKILLSAAFICVCIISNAQDKAPEPKEGWKKTGNISFLFNQSSFSKWTTGGENNVSATLGINYDFNYVKGDVTWDNKIIASYGLTKTANSEFEKKTDDRFEFNSLYGKKSSGNWYYSAFVNLKTQFSKGYTYGKDSAEKEIRNEFTKLLSPGYLTLGPGMLWKKNDNLKFNIAPLTSKITFIDKGLRKAQGILDNSYFGVDPGKSTRYEVGLNASGYYKLNIMNNVSMENILSLYTNYLEEAKNIDLDYTMNLVMTINKYLSANLTFQTVYDDNAYRGFQTREVFGIGINYGF